MLSADGAFTRMQFEDKYKNVAKSFPYGVHFDLERQPCCLYRAGNYGDGTGLHYCYVQAMEKAKHSFTRPGGVIVVPGMPTNPIWMPQATFELWVQVGEYASDCVVI